MTDAKPFWVKCLSCSHVWPAAYLPMEIDKCAKLLKKASCPKCAAGSKQITFAKQDDGALLEQAS